MRNTLSVSRENRSSPSPGGTPANPRRREISSPNFDGKIRGMEFPDTQNAFPPEESKISQKNSRGFEKIISGNTS